jgi:hypothetical protein
MRFIVAGHIIRVFAIKAIVCNIQHVPQQYTKSTVAFALQQCYANAPQCHVTRAFPVILFIWRDAGSVYLVANNVP